MEIYIFTIQFYQFSYSNARGSEYVYYGEVAFICTIVAKLLQLFIAQHLFHERVGLYLMNPPDRTFGYVVLIFEPCKET